jgi:hypothetical protein
MSCDRQTPQGQPAESLRFFVNPQLRVCGYLSQNTDVI